tara:strand:+ start:2986 stop:3276 length:291 start_codon:yes stop_codon:yes gene_type:complete
VRVQFPSSPLTIKYFNNGVIFRVEVLKPRTRSKSWGDVDPATGKTTGSYGNEIGIEEKDSKITKENGYINIVTLPAGCSPGAYIEMRQKQIKNEIT